jgi:hypothetical protein
LRQKCLGLSSDYRRRSSEEGVYEKELRAPRLRGRRDACDDANGARQRLRSGCLYDQMGDLAKRAVTLTCLTIRMRVPNLHNGGTDDQRAAEKAQCRPE